jgi:glutamate-1-semialdehyde 2,1-aminomutase
MNSKEYFARASRVIPGGVNSPVRAFRAVGGEPVFVSSGHGARLRTVEGRELTDYCCSWGPLLFGHAHPRIVEAITQAAAQGTSFGVSTPREVEMAETLCAMVPSMEMVRLVSSGTEAAMTALRLARGVTGRAKVIKFDGCYHGHADAFLVAAGSGLLTGGISSSKGVTPAAAADVYVAPYNDLAAVERIATANASELAAIIVEPVAGNMGLVPPAAGFLAGLRQVADRTGAVLIFDEVITGFRLGPTTYGMLCGVKPDLTVLGKIIGGGAPIGAVGGRAELMRELAPLGGVYQAGTLSGNPLAVAAGLAMLALIREEKPYARLEALGARLAEGLRAAASAAGVPLHVARLGSMFTPFFCAPPVTDLATAKHADTARFAAFFRGMAGEGIYLPPAQFEAAFLSTAHTEADVDAFIAAAGRQLRG